MIAHPPAQVPTALGHESDKGLGGTKKVTSVVFCPCIHAASAQLIDLHIDPKSIKIILKS